MASAAGVPFLTLRRSSTKIPALVYGTAWKKDQTTDLVYKALKAGFTGIDTAAQPKHYREDLVGNGVRKAIDEGLVKREDIYLQTKFTPPGGQDLSNLPYDPSASIENQVKTSLASSLKNLQTTDGTQYLDCLMFHSPLSTLNDTLTAWKVCEEYVPHKIRNLGISNLNLAFLEPLWEAVKTKPAVVQIRFYRATRFEVPLRRFCRANEIVFQSYWTLTANPALLKSNPIQILATDAKVSREIALYSLVLGLEHTVILDGTTKESTMREDLEGIRATQIFAKEHSERWAQILKEFKGLIGED